MKSLVCPKRPRLVALALVVAMMAAACGRNVLHTGVTAPPVALPVPVPVHSDGTCDPGLAPCLEQAAGFCFDLQASPDHCGICGNACPLGTPCDSGQCRVVHCTSQISVHVMRVDYAFGLRYQIALADFDRDGSLDMVAPTPRTGDWTIDMGNTASVFRGNGDGTFVRGAIYPAQVDPTNGFGGFAVVAADLNQDQIPDLVMRVKPTSALLTAGAFATIVVRLGNGDGTFGSEIGLAAGADPISIAIADFDSDGKLDLANVAEEGKRVSVYHGNGDGTFSNRQDLVVGGAPRSVTATDWNSDGIPDLVAADAYIHLVLGTGNGQFAQSIDCGLSLATPSASPGPPVIADFDRDGLVDLAASDTVMFGMRECNFTRLAGYSASYNTALPMAAGDFNGDGAPDLAFASWDGVGFMPGDGKGNFGTVVILGNLDDNVHPTGPEGTTVVTGDVNGDGRLDLVVANQNSVRVFLNTCR